MGLQLRKPVESEKVTEKYLTKRVKEIGGLSFKWESTGHQGVPDRILIFKGGKVIFVEVKSENGKVTQIQELTIQELRNQGCEVYVVYTKHDVNELLRRMV